MYLEAGCEFSKYKIVRELGRGGMGVVYLAEDQSLGRRIALKVLDLSVTSAADFEQRFRQEAKIIAGLNHTNIMSVHSLEKIGNELAIDMPFMENGSLAKVLAEERISVAMALRYTRDILLALACCHEEGVVHCDVKPDNILLSKDGKAMLSDFGLARLKTEYQQTVISKSSSSGIFLGTPRYAPPESWDGQPPTPAWDVYSLGMVLFEALTGRVAYEADTPLALMKQMVLQPLPDIREWAPGISDTLVGVVNGMLAKDPGSRFSNAGEVLEQFKDLPELRNDPGQEPEAMVRHIPMKVPRPRRARPPSLHRPFSKRVFAVFLVVATVLATLGGWFYLGPALSSRQPVQTTAPVPLGAVPSPMYRVFDTYAPEAQATWEQHWLMIQGERPGEWEILAAQDTHIWLLRAQSVNADTLDLTGHWARYSDPTARTFEYGTVQGSARWVSPDREMAVKLEFRNEQTASEQKGHFLVRLVQSNASDTQVIRRMENNSYFQPILYSELAPRHQPWVESIERRFLSRTEPVVKVPQVKDPAARPQVDGELSPIEWPPLPTERPEDAGGVFAKDRATHLLRLSYDRDNLYIAIEVRDSIADPVVALTVIDVFSVPVQRVSQWSARFQQGRLLEHQRIVLDRALTWNCEWQSAFRQVDGGWNIEMAVPFSNTQQKAQPQAGVRWRLLCTVTGKDDRASVRWGSAGATPSSGSVIAIFGE